MGAILDGIFSDEEFPRPPNKIPDYIITIRSGHEHNKPSSANVCFVFTNVDGKQSRDIEYCHIEPQREGFSFSPGRNSRFPVSGMREMGKLAKMELSQTRGGRWYVQWVEIMDAFTGDQHIFPVNRWMYEGRKIVIKTFDSVLPQDDEETAQRNRELEEKRTMYEFSWRLPEGGMPLTKNVPLEDQLTEEYTEYLKKVKGALLRQGVKNIFKSKKWETLEDVNNIYGGLFFKPSCVDLFKEDRFMGKQRLNGANPGLIRICTTIPDNFPVTNEMLQTSMEGLTIAEAIVKKKMFIVNYASLCGLPCKPKEDKRRICSPIALFFVNKDNDLMPIAIQLHQKPGQQNPIFLPSDNEYTWLLAKLWFQSADALHHQTANHGLTHFLLESVCVAIHRCISPSHPVFRLLIPHFYGLLAINQFAIQNLINIGGYVDKMYMCGVVGSLETISRAYKTWRLDVQGDLLNDLKNRGVDDPELLPNYYYRDDGLLYWHAINKYVGIVVNGQYNTPKKLEEDTEIQYFAKTLVCPSTGCGMKGVPGEGSFSTNEQLIDTLTSFIYISAVVHAAVNSPQYDTYSSPFGCMHLIGTPPTNKNPVTEKFILDTLLDKKGCLANMVYHYILSTQGSTNRLGDFEADYQFDPIGKKALEVFRHDLKHIALTIEERNAQREVPYPYLHPKSVNNSTGI